LRLPKQGGALSFGLLDLSSFVTISRWLLFYVVEWLPKSPFYELFMAFVIDSDWHCRDICSKV